MPTTADLTLAVRKALIKAMRENAALTALVPATRVYGVEPPATPAWPFVRYGFASTVPSRASCLNGRDVSVAIHAFAKGPGEDACSAIGNAVERALDGLTIPLDNATAHVTLSTSQILRDGDEASAYHHISQWLVEVAA